MKTANKAQSPGSKNRIGFWSAVLTTVLTVISFSIAINGTPLNSYAYPYIAPFIPFDFAWLIPAGRSRALEHLHFPYKTPSF